MVNSTSRGARTAAAWSKAVLEDAARRLPETARIRIVRSLRGAGRRPQLSLSFPRRISCTYFSSPSDNPALTKSDFGVVDTGRAPPHQTLLVELPKFVSVGPIPLAIFIV